MSTDKAKEDIRHGFILCTATVCVFFITGASICLNTYIQAVYELEKTKFLRHPYYSV